MGSADILINRSEIVAAVGSIEALPASVSRLLEVVGREEFSAGDVLDVVRYDAVLAGDVLARANSADSAAIRRIADLGEAASRLGASTIVEIALRRAMRDRLVSPVPAYGLRAEELWHHSILASVGADQVRRHATVPVPPMITTAALVHDVGKLVIASCLPESLTDALLVAAEAESLTLEEAERRVVGLDHGEVGGLVVRAWGLPLSVQLSLTQHHGFSGGDAFTHALVLSDRLAYAVVDVDDHEPDPAIVDAAVAELLREAGASLLACGIAGPVVAQLVVDTAAAVRDVLDQLDT